MSIQKRFGAKIMNNFEDRPLWYIHLILGHFRPFSNFFLKPELYPVGHGQTDIPTKFDWKNPKIVIYRVLLNTGVI